MMSSPFKLVLHVREKLFNSGILRVHKLSCPVLSIGNLTLGGTGKTPLTILLAQKLHERGFHPVILSRGYGRTTRGVRIVSRGDGPLCAWQESGDEPYLMAQRLKNIGAVVVGESRYLAGRKAEHENLGDVFLLDDGFQHRQLHRGFDIVTIDPVEWEKGEALLPIGRWREHKSAIHRAHAACVQERTLSDVPIPLFTVRIEPHPLPLKDWSGKRITAFAGIAKPERFFQTLESMGVPIHRRVAFSDHHIYTDSELQELDGDIRVTTEKDAVKLQGRGDFVALRVTARIDDFDRLEKMILQSLGS
jgi:tetraacyldisaccharide 4'-kinase